MSEHLHIAGRAYTDEQKRAIIDRLYEVWVANPELRLGQLIINAVYWGHSELSTSRLFYREDEQIAQDLEDRFRGDMTKLDRIHE